MLSKLFVDTESKFGTFWFSPEAYKLDGSLFAFGLQLVTKKLRISTRCQQKVCSARRVTPRKYIRSTIVWRLRSIQTERHRIWHFLYVSDTNSQLKSYEFRLGVNKKFAHHVELPLNNTLDWPFYDLNAVQAVMAVLVCFNNLRCKVVNQPKVSPYDLLTNTLCFYFLILRRFM